MNRVSFYYLQLFIYVCYFCHLTISINLFLSKCQWTVLFIYLTSAVVTIITFLGSSVLASPEVQIGSCTKWALNWSKLSERQSLALWSGLSGSFMSNICTYCMFSLLCCTSSHTLCNVASQLAATRCFFFLLARSWSICLFDCVVWVVKIIVLFYVFCFCLCALNL